jgi:hypothetical protein
MHERFCAGLALTAAYWAAEPPDDSDHDATSPALPNEVRTLRCSHPIARPRQRRATSDR